MDCGDNDSNVVLDNDNEKRLFIVTSRVYTLNVVGTQTYWWFQAKSYSGLLLYVRKIEQLIWKLYKR